VEQPSPRRPRPWRLIFDATRELGSVHCPERNLDNKGIRSKQRTYGKGPCRRDSVSRGALYALTVEQVYIGEDRA